jgi:Fur family zinc uptake transcriptional regulator
MSAHPAFSAHDHAACAHGALERAEAVCAERDARLTPTRRRVLEILAESHRPVGAYDLIERLGESGKLPAPTTVYRALDFLLEHGLAHRIESRNAFVACSHGHDGGEVIVFLICERCGAAAESGAAGLGREIGRLAAAAGFSPSGQVIELAGECGNCRSAHAAER